MQGTTTITAPLCITDPQFGALGIGSAHDDWPAFEAAFAYARAQSVAGLRGTISLYIPKPAKYYWCSRRLRPGCQVNLYGDGYQEYGGYQGVGADGGSTIRFPAGCPGLFLDSYFTTLSPYAPPGLKQSHANVISKLNFYGGGVGGLPILGSPTPRWAVNLNCTPNMYFKPSSATINQSNGLSTVYSYVVRTVNTGNTGTVEITWPGMDAVTGYVDGKILYDSGVSNPPPGSFPSGGNGTMIYELLLAAGIRIQSVATKLQEVSIYGFCGSGILIFGSSGQMCDMGGVEEDWELTTVWSFNHDRHAVQVSWARAIGQGDTGAGCAKNLTVGACGRESIIDVGDVGSVWINVHSEYDNPSYATKVIDTPFTPSIVVGGYSEHHKSPFYGSLTMVYGCYDTMASLNGASSTIDPTSTGFAQNAHKCNWLLGWKGITPRLGVGMCLGTYASVYGPADVSWQNAAFTICVHRNTHNGFNATTAESNEQYYFTYYNFQATPVQGCFYLHVGGDTKPSQSPLLGWGLTTTDSPHGAGHFLLGTGGYFGVTTPAWPGYWYGHPTRSGVRYIAYDLAGYALGIADNGNRAVGDRVDTPAATINHQSWQVTRPGLVATVWQATRQYMYNGNLPSPPLVRPRNPALNQAWRLDPTLAGWPGYGNSGMTEPSWPSSPAIGDTVMDSSGTIRWKYDGVCAGYQPYGSVEGIAPTINVAGNANVTLSESDERFLAKKLIVTGALTGDVCLILPTLTPSNTNNTLMPTETYDRYVRNSTTGPYTLTVKTAAGTGVTIAQGMGAMVSFDGVNIFRMTPDVTP